MLGTKRLFFVALCLGLPFSLQANAEPFFGSAFGSLTSAPEDPEALGPYVFDYVLQTNLTGTGARTEIATFSEDRQQLFGTQTWTADDGDEIFLDFQADITSETTAMGVYTFTGGTGKFEGSSGQADFTAIFPDFDNVSIVFKGTLVPEPSSLTLLGLAGLFTLTGRRRARG